MSDICLKYVMELRLVFQHDICGYYSSLEWHSMKRNRKDRSISQDGNSTNGHAAEFCEATFSSHLVLSSAHHITTIAKKNAAQLDELQMQAKNNFRGY